MSYSRSVVATHSAGVSAVLLGSCAVGSDQQLLDCLRHSTPWHVATCYGAPRYSQPVPQLSQPGGATACLYEEVGRCELARSVVAGGSIRRRSGTVPCDESANQRSVVRLVVNELLCSYRFAAAVHPFTPASAGMWYLWFVIMAEPATAAATRHAAHSAAGVVVTTAQAAIGATIACWCFCSGLHRAVTAYG